MARKPLLECSFLIPVRRDRNLSNGRLHRQEDWDWLEAQFHPFGGGTRALELYEGWYLDPDTREVVKDRSAKYTVAVSREEVARLRLVLRKACRVFGQKCIYLSVAGHVEFVEGQSNETA
jgi:hypothetical protein